MVVPHVNHTWLLRSDQCKHQYQEQDIPEVIPIEGIPFLNQSNSNQLNLTQHRRGGENRRIRRKTTRSRVENQQTQPTYDAESGNRTRATLVEGEYSHFQHSFGGMRDEAKHRGGMWNTRNFN